MTNFLYSRHQKFTVKKRGGGKNFCNFVTQHTKRNGGAGFSRYKSRYKKIILSRYLYK